MRRPEVGPSWPVQGTEGSLCGWNIMSEGEWGGEVLVSLKELLWVGSKASAQKAIYLKLKLNP